MVEADYHDSRDSKIMKDNRGEHDDDNNDVLI